MASSGEDADCDQLDIPSLTSSSLESVFSLSILAYCRNMADSVKENLLPLLI